MLFFYYLINIDKKLIMKINNYMLGISDSHESGICLIKNKKVIFAINEKKIHDYKRIKIFQKTIKLARKN